MVRFGRACHLSCTKRKTAECCVPGSSMALRSRVTPFGQSSRNDANELATPLSDASSLGRPVPEALKLKRPRGPPASCVCSRRSRLWRHSPPSFTVWLRSSFVNVVATFHVVSERSHGRLGEKPSTGAV